MKHHDRQTQRCQDHLSSLSSTPSMSSFSQQQPQSLPQQLDPWRRDPHGAQPLLKDNVTAVDTSETANGKAVVVDVCSTRDEALNVIKNDMESYVDDAAGMELVVDFDKWSARTEDYSYGSEWNISEHDLEIKEN